VSAEIPPMIRDDSIAFQDQGVVSLRGIPEPTHLHTAHSVHAVTGRR
jgi:hypothetical protein